MAPNPLFVEKAYGSTIVPPTLEIQPGYTFDSWYKEASRVILFDQTQPIVEDITIYSKCEAEKYTLTFDWQGAGEFTTEQVTYDELMPFINSTTRIGFVFKGFFASENGLGAQYYDSNFSPVTNKKWDQTIASPTIYAYWSIFEYSIAEAGVTITGVAKDAVLPVNLVLPASIQGKSVIAIGASVFNADITPACGSIESIVIPASVKTIGNLAFNGCINVQTLTFADNSELTSIGNSAFNNLRNITSVSMPSTVATIGSNAFNGCAKLLSMEFISAGAPTLGTGLFTTFNPKLLIYVPAANLGAYKSGGWASHQDLVRPKTISVLFDGKGGPAVDTQIVTYGQYATVPTMAPRTGYIFEGWYTDDVTFTKPFVFATTKVAYENMTAENKETSTITLYAKYRPITYQVVFDKNAEAATGTTSTLSNCSYGTEYYLSANGFQNVGYTFQGWATSPTGAVQYGDGVKVQNLSQVDDQTITLYAVWA